MMLRLIISGGQTGVDQAAWRAAQRLGLRTAGWMPTGFMTEQGPRPEFAELFNARSSSSADPDDRTRANIDEADATIILADDQPGPGTALTISYCDSRESAYLCVESKLFDDPVSIESTARWIKEQQVAALNVAGDRESTKPGIGERAEIFLSEVFIRVILGRST